ncbi:YeeE/YedE family protein [Muriicola sp. Z0-33]|uniref:YeeE/YedE family protein n=1 Tax=Muriicola sp. Z0-33 TaxID=2816957 RepID=UPI00223757F4|nr:YeeE/YedE family protein [Muriicola sp. Z0-33]MCW5515487.1 YeeE/YedE family protein [Muriicola sp. Z0-33]
MRTVSYLLIGIVFGITMFKSEAASWFRIYEMFKFESFHMYGIIGSALLLGILVVQFIKRTRMKSFYNEKIVLPPKEMNFYRYIFGGIIFGLGWALAGACPGPMFTLAGAGYVSIFVVIGAAILGTFLYGLLKDKLPH